VHTHPAADGLIAPPSADDYDDLNFDQFPIQLVAETSDRRIWGIFTPGVCSLLGQLLNRNQFFPFRESTDLVYQIISSDQRRMNALDAERASRDAAYERYRARMRELRRRPP
jgi:hypothetical protein